MFVAKKCYYFWWSPWLFKGKRIVSDPGMHHGTRVTHVPWCMSGSLTCGGGKTFPAFPAHAQPAIWRIWQEAHCQIPGTNVYTTVQSKSIQIHACYIETINNDDDDDDNGGIRTIMKWRDLPGRLRSRISVVNSRTELCFTAVVAWGLIVFVYI